MRRPVCHESRAHAPEAIVNYAALNDDERAAPLERRLAQRRKCYTLLAHIHMRFPRYRHENFLVVRRGCVSPA